MTEQPFISGATCLVTAADHRRFWRGESADASSSPECTTDRRIGLADRRSSGHERRWDASSGRRHGVSDRRGRKASR